MLMFQQLVRAFNVYILECRNHLFLTKVVVILRLILRGFVIFSFYFWNIFRPKNLNSRLKNAKKRLNISLNGLYTLHLGLSHNEPCEVSIFTNLILQSISEKNFRCISREYNVKKAYQFLLQYFQ